ncbi:MAG: peptide-methionine (S)-S-oxide reductase MsrA [Gammaproteobacteria bacterium]
MMLPNRIFASLALLIGLSSALALALTSAPKDDEQSASLHVKTLVLGSGCFWGAEKGYEALPGVIDAVSGYADGRNITPSYDVITRPEHRFDPDNYAETVRVRYNTEMLSTQALLRHFFEHHDPTQKDGQGNDLGTQYRSIILYSDEEQRATALRTRDEFQALLKAAGYGDIVTEIEPLEAFHEAEDYHQDYLAKNPLGYCPDHSTGVTFDEAESKPADNAALLQDKQILVLEAEHCPYCARFRRDVADAYRGSIPLTYRSASQLDGLTLRTPTWATPTIYFLDGGKEAFGHQGYMTSAEFYQALGAFKLGDSEAYEVAFAKNTDDRFCRQYEEFKHTPDGVFIDKLSGAALFDTRDRFDSGSGWLSFTRPVEGATVEAPDDSHGMQRTEVLSKSSGIHLGHVFDDGPGGKPRYCINATVLEFAPRKQ